MHTTKIGNVIFNHHDDFGGNISIRTKENTGINEINSLINIDLYA